MPGTRQATPAQRALGLAFCATLAGLLGVGTGVDMRDQIPTTTTNIGVWPRLVLHVREDGGEAVFGSVAAAPTVAVLPPLSPRARS